jgi:Xaa-Pro dipeptidase
MGDLTTKINTAIQDAGYDALVAVGVSNFTYLSGIVMPFSRNYPDRLAMVIWTKEGEKSIISPIDWAEAARDQDWKGQILICEEGDYVPNPNISAKLVQAFSDLGLSKGKVGIDHSTMSERLFQQLSVDIPSIEWADCGDLLRRLRRVKTREEVKLLEIAAKQTQRGLLGTTNHLEGTLESPGGIGYSIAEISERIRVHISEYSASHPGHLATMRGPDAAIYYVPQQVTTVVQQGDLVRLDATYHFRGYWSNAARMLVVGRPTAEQERAFEDNLFLKAAAAEQLMPHVSCSEVFHAVDQAAEANGVEFWREAGVGYGVGTSPREAPYLARTSDDVLDAGMVVVLDVYTYGPRMELIHSKDTYEITEDGHRLVGQYRAWDCLHEIKGVQAVVQD